MTTMHRVEDLAEPRLPLPVRILNRALAPLEGWVRLSENFLLKGAMKKAGLTDFGDERFCEPLRMLVDALKRESRR